MLLQDGVFQSIVHRVQSAACKESKLLKSYADGTICKKHAPLSHDQYAVRLHMYID